MTTGSLRDRVDGLDPTLSETITSGGTSPPDRRSLLALHAALAARGPFRYLEIGSYHGASMQALVADDRCRSIVSIDRRDLFSPDERSVPSYYPDNTTARMLELLRSIEGADLSKLTTIDSGSDGLDPGSFEADLCLIDGEHTDRAALADGKFCRQVVGGRGVIAFHDRAVVHRGIRRLLSELPDARVYPLSAVLLVVELGVPTLSDDPRVSAQVPGPLWRAATRRGLVRPLLAAAPALRAARRTVGLNVAPAGPSASARARPASGSSDAGPSAG